jgi:hypothetical protein
MQQRHNQAGITLAGLLCVSYYFQHPLTHALSHSLGVGFGSPVTPTAAAVGAAAKTAAGTTVLHAPRTIVICDSNCVPKQQQIDKLPTRLSCLTTLNHAQREEWGSKSVPMHRVV